MIENYYSMRRGSRSRAAAELGASIVSRLDQLSRRTEGT